MFDMLLWFAVVMVLFAVGDVVAKLTKARISSVFATLMLFLAGAALLILGMGFFTLGADMAMMPIGEQVGTQLTRSKRLCSAPLPAGACQCCSSPWGP